MLQCSPNPGDRNIYDLLDLSDGLLLVVRLGQILQLIAEVQGLRRGLAISGKPEGYAGIW